MCMGYAYIPGNLSVRQHNAVGLRLFDETRTISDWHAHQLQAHFLYVHILMLTREALGTVSYSYLLQPLTQGATVYLQ